MYDENYFFVDNPINRYSISAAPGSQGERGRFRRPSTSRTQSPGADKESNWLPAPKDKFILMMRLYWPKEGNPSILDGSWAIPAVTKVD